MSETLFQAVSEKIEKIKNELSETLFQAVLEIVKDNKLKEVKKLIKIVNKLDKNSCTPLKVCKNGHQQLFKIKYHPDVIIYLSDQDSAFSEEEDSTADSDNNYY